MRIDKDISKRSIASKTKQPIAIAFLLSFEGCVTERIYFEGLGKLIKSNKLIYPVVRDSNESGWSDPIKLINGFKEQENKILSDISFDKDLDKICFIVDRDKYPKERYDEVIEICKKEKYFLFVTNPCFEFWLLLHFIDCININQAELKKNKRQTNSCTFIEKELSGHLKSYKNKRFRFDDIKNRINQALQNVKKYCTDNEGLEFQLGSSLGGLIKELIC